MSVDADVQDVSDYPDPERIAAAIEAVLEFADRLPPDEQALEVTGWTDGDLDVHLVHNISTRELEAVAYDADRDAVVFTHIYRELGPSGELRPDVLDEEVLAEDVLGPST